MLLQWLTITVVLFRVLQVKPPLVFQTSFIKEDLEDILAPVLKANGVQYGMTVDRKTLAGDNCSVCFQSLDDKAEKVQCTECQGHVHTRCFNQYTVFHGGWIGEIKCPVCEQLWTQAGTWGQQAIELEDIAIAEVRAASKAAAKEAKKAAKKKCDE